MKFFSLVFLMLSFGGYSQKNNRYDTQFEKGNGNQSATYPQTIDFYQILDDDFKTIEMREAGETDSGKNLHIVIYNGDGNFNFDDIKKNKIIILINNGIHAGEPDGIDATMMLFRDLATGKIQAPKNAVVVAIPVYNIGGALNRNSTTRVNQNGPEEYGFRGNARNYDLNRDFIKSDTKNTKSFIAVFHLLNPDIFIDNHVSNGADYQYTLTYIQTQHDKLGNVLGSYLDTQMMPALTKKMQRKEIEMTPYVNVWNGTPEQGFSQFFESPRFATGYTSLFNTIGFVVETHMLKKYADRVKATYEFMLETINYGDLNHLAIKQKRRDNETQYQPGNSYTLKWEIDSSKVSKLSFMGYEGSYKKSDVTTGNRLFYDRKKPYKKDIDYYKKYKSAKEIVIPDAYIVPQGFWHVIDLLKGSHARYTQLKNDTIIEVESYKIADYKTLPNAYEGHYPHNNTKITSTKIKVSFAKGDYVFSTKQKAVKLLLETLEPDAVDSYFNWNFFDTVLQQKEGYSDYVFEDLAAQYLKENPDLRDKLERMKKEDKAFSENAEAQLYWVYKNSIYYEKEHLQYPVYRIVR